MSRKVKLAFCVLVAIIAVQAWVIFHLHNQLEREVETAEQLMETASRHSRDAEQALEAAKKRLQEAEERLKRAQKDK